MVTEGNKWNSILSHKTWFILEYSTTKLLMLNTVELFSGIEEQGMTVCDSHRFIAHENLEVLTSLNEVMGAYNTSTTIIVMVITSSTLL